MTLRQCLFGTLRRQLTLGVALVIGVLMSALVLDLTLRQRETLLARRAAATTGLAQVLAISAAGWLAARDTAGLQELVDAELQFPQLRFAMLLDRQGQVLAHSDRARVGQYVRDLPAPTEPVTLTRSELLVEVMVPVRLGPGVIGWARVGMDRRADAAQLAALTRTGVMSALAAIIAGALIATLIGARLTRRLARIQAVADAVEQGHDERRAWMEGSDEAARLARAFDRMLDSKTASRAALADSEQRLRMALEAAAMVAWRWDVATDRTVWSDNLPLLMGARPAGGYLDVRDMVIAEDRAEFLGAGRAALEHDDSYEIEFRLRRTDGEVRWFQTRGRTLRDASRRAVAMLGVTHDITERKALQAELILHRDHLEEIVAGRTTELNAARLEAERLTRV